MVKSQLPKYNNHTQEKTGVITNLDRSLPASNIKSVSFSIKTIFLYNQVISIKMFEVLRNVSSVPGNGTFYSFSKSSQYSVWAKLPGQTFPPSAFTAVKPKCGLHV